jgi:hypothetical protein
VKKERKEIPVLEVVDYWEEKDRSFLILEWIPGQTLRDAWVSLTPSQYESLADEVAGYCTTLASIESSQLQSVSGGPVLEPYLVSRLQQENSTILSGLSLGH